MDTKSHAIEVFDHAIGMAILDQFLGRLTKSGKRLVLEPEDRLIFIACQFGGARNIRAISPNLACTAGLPGCAAWCCD